MLFSLSLVVWTSFPFQAGGEVCAVCDESEICAPFDFDRGELCDKSEKSENCAWWDCANFAGFLRFVVLSCRVIPTAVECSGVCAVAVWRRASGVESIRRKWVLSGGLEESCLGPFA